MEDCFSFLKRDLVKIFDVRQVYNDPHALHFIRSNIQKNYLHEITYETDLPKRIELGDAVDDNPYHLYFYMNPGCQSTYVPFINIFGMDMNKKRENSHLFQENVE